MNGKATPCYFQMKLEWPYKYQIKCISDQRILSVNVIAVFELLSHVWLFCNLMDCSPPGSSVHGIFQVRILESVAISRPRGSSGPRDWICASCIVRRILYHGNSREAPQKLLHNVKGIVSSTGCNSHKHLYPDVMLIT